MPIAPTHIEPEPVIVGTGRAFTVTFLTVGLFAVHPLLLV
jgi:hypothetical protein